MFKQMKKNKKVLILEDLHSSINKKKFTQYAKAGDEADVICDLHYPMLLVTLPFMYVMDSTGKSKQIVRVNWPTSFAVHRDKTNYDNPKAVVKSAEVVEPPAQTRKSLGAPRVGRKRK